MPYKDASVRKAYHKQRSREYYLKNRDKVLASVKISRAVGKARWDTFKRTLKCTQCGFNHPAALDFHHKDPATKDRAVSWFIKNSQFTRAIEEAMKCIVLCANCHRKHHWEEKKNPTG
jgi:protein-arginine kinase activator protein McsA